MTFLAQVTAIEIKLKCNVGKCGNWAAILTNQLQCYCPHISHLVALVVFFLQQWHVKCCITI